MRCYILCQIQIEPLRTLASQSSLAAPKHSPASLHDHDGTYISCQLYLLIPERSLTGTIITIDTVSYAQFGQNASIFGAVASQSPMDYISQCDDVNSQYCCGN